MESIGLPSNTFATFSSSSRELASISCGTRRGMAESTCPATNHFRTLRARTSASCGVNLASIASPLQPRRHTVTTRTERTFTIEWRRLPLRNAQAHLRASRYNGNEASDPRWPPDAPHVRCHGVRGRLGTKDEITLNAASVAATSAGSAFALETGRTVN